MVRRKPRDRSKVERRCSIDGCDKPHRAKSWCIGHYRMSKRGTLFPMAKPEIFWDFVEVTDDCWLWTGTISPAGYGSFSNSTHGTQIAHRIAYSKVHGPIPEGMFIDHKCHVRECVNPEHLRLATPQQNSRNRLTHKNSQTGVSNVTLTREGNYQVRFTVDRHTKGYGTYKTLSEAAIIAEQVKIKLFGEFACIA